MEFLILGDIEAWRDDNEIAMSPKLRTILCALLLGGGLVGDSELSGLLWGLHPPASASALIYTYASRLRQRLAPEVRLKRKPPGYVLHRGTTGLDWEDFQLFARSGRQDFLEGRYASASDWLDRALALWRGRPASNTTEFLAQREQPLMEERRMEVLKMRIEADLMLGRAPHLVGELTALVNDNPFQERLRAYLMICLYRCDRQSDALAVYDRGRRALGEELGIDPGPGLSRTFQAILSGRLDGDGSTVAYLLSMHRQPAIALEPTA